MTAHDGFDSLTIAEQTIAATTVLKALQQLPWPRTIAVFKALASGEELLIPGSSRGSELTLRSMPTLMRDERAIALSVHLVLLMELGEDATGRVISILAEPTALLAAQSFGVALLSSIASASQHAAETSATLRAAACPARRPGGVGAWSVGARGRRHAGHAGTRLGRRW